MSTRRRTPHDLRVRWWDRTRDPEYERLLASVCEAAHQDIPDVMDAPDQVRPEFASLVKLIQQRVQNLCADAIAAAAEDVEMVVVNARMVSCDDFHLVTGGPDAGRTGRQGRADARRLQLAEQVWRAEQRVVTATAVHCAAVEAQVAYGLDAIAAMDAALRTHHRMSTWLTYAVPDHIDIPDRAYEIGLTRVRSALNHNPVEDTQEGVA